MDRVDLPAGLNMTGPVPAPPFASAPMPAAMPIQGPVDILVPSQPSPGGPSAVIRPRPMAGWPSAYPTGASLPASAYAGFAPAASPAPSASAGMNAPMPEIPPPWMVAPYLYGARPAPMPMPGQTPSMPGFSPFSRPDKEPAAADKAPDKPPEGASSPEADAAAENAALSEQLTGMARGLQSSSEASQRQGLSTQFIKFMSAHPAVTKPGHPLRDKAEALMINLLQDPDAIVANAALTVLEAGDFYNPTSEMKSLVSKLATDGRMEGILSTAAKSALAGWQTYLPPSGGEAPEPQKKAA